MNNLIIREATRKDSKKILAFTRKAGDETDNLSYGSEGLTYTIEQEEKFLEEAHNNSNSVFYCVYLMNELIATGSLTGLSNRMNHRAELGITVLRHYWGKGIGSTLLNSLIDYARNNKIEIIDLKVRKDNNRAIKLYEKAGFVKCGELPAFMKVNDEYVDFISMYLDLRKQD